MGVGLIADGSTLERFPGTVEFFSSFAEAVES